MKNSMQAPKSIRCLRAIEAYNGGREELAEKLGTTRGCVDQWIRKGRVAPGHILNLVKLGDHKFTAEELLGGFDATRN